MRRALSILARGAGGLVVFLAAAAGGVVVHLDTPTFRRLAIGIVNGALTKAIRGRLTIEHVDRLSIGEVEGLDAHVEDPSGIRVLRLERAHASIAVWPLLRSLAGSGDVMVELPEAIGEHADLDLDTDADGVPLIARAFEAPPSTGGGGPPGRGVELSIAHTHVASTRVHGITAGVVVDADVTDADTAIHFTPGHVALDRSSARVVFRTRVGAELRGTVEGHLAHPSPAGADFEGAADWSGTVAGIAGTAHLKYDGGKIAAIADVPAVSPEAARAAWPACPFTEPATAHAEAEGTWPRLDLVARASVGAGAVELRGPVDLAPEVHADLHMQATDVDLRALYAKAPSTVFSASGGLVATLHESGEARVETTLVIPAGTVASVRTPPATVHASATVDASGRLTGADAALTARESGATVRATGTLVPVRDSYRLTVDGTATSALDTLPRLPPLAHGQTTAKLRGTLDLDSRKVDASVDATASGIARDGQTADSATLVARATGPLDAPQIDADLHAKGLVLGGRPYDELEIQAHGTTRNAPVVAWLTAPGFDAKVRGDMTIDGGVTLRDVHASAHRGADRAWSHTGLVRVASGEVRVEDASIEGLGSPLQVDLRRTPSTLDLRARTERLDLASALRLVGVSAPAGGTLGLDVDASITPSRANGRLVADLVKLPVPRLGEASAHVDATLDGRRATGKVTATLSDVGTLAIESSSVQVGGAGPLALASWKRAWGGIDITAHVDLAALSSRLPKDQLPVDRLGGRLDATAHIGRDSETDDTPDAAIEAHTTDLAVDGAGGAWNLRGTDASLRVRADGRTGETHVDAEAHDRTGSLVAVSATSSHVPYARLFAPGEPRTADLLAMPFDAAVDVPSRDVTTLPPWLGLEGQHGQVDAHVTWTGSVDQPLVRASANLLHGKTDTAVAAIRVDLDFDATYDGARVDATLGGSSRKAQLLDASASVDVRAHDIVDALRTGAPLPWTASGSATLTRFPLQTIAALDDRQVRGHASGKIVVERLHDDARGSLSLDVADGRVGDVPCKAAHVEATISDGALDASARIDQEDGGGELRGHAGVVWGSALRPAIDETKPVDGSLRARQLRAALLLPFFPRYFSSLDGRIDADVRDHVDLAARTMRPEGTAKLTGGTMELHSLGGELRDIGATLTLTPDGVIRLESVSARGLTGHVIAAASGRLQGLGLGAANATVLIPQKEPLPIIFDGVQVGTLDGGFQLTGARARDGSRFDMDLDAPTMTMLLPLTAAHAVQPLGQLAGVTIGRRSATGEYTVVSLEGTSAEEPTGEAPGMPVRLVVKLGNAVEVKRGTDLDLYLSGGPVVTFADKVTVEGQIRITRGRISVQGKPFDVEKGTVTFVGDDPANPQVVLTAGWSAPDGSKVYADFAGPLKTGKVELRSEPPRPKNEIIALIVTGSADQGVGAVGSAQSQTSGATGAATSAGTLAAGAAGATATAPINQALGNVNRVLDNFGVVGGLSTTIDTSQANPRPEVELQIARDISVQLAVVLGVPPPGASQDTTYVTLDWRFLSKWSLRATYGNLGTSILDVVWQHRY